MNKLLHFGIAISLGGFAIGCSSSAEPTTNVQSCVPTPGPTSCVCADGTYGIQECLSDGSLSMCSGCGNTAPIAPQAPAPDNGGGGTVIMNDPNDVVLPDGVDAPPDVVENPHGYAECGSDPANQPSPCIDPWGAVRCKVNSGYPGDDLALCQPDPEEGFLMHFGPTDYSNPDLVAPFLLYPGEEREFCMYLNTPNMEDRFVHSYHGRMRANSHHLIVTMPQMHVQDDLFPWTCSSQVIDRWLFGSQDPQIDVAEGLGDGQPAQPGDPDYGLAMIVPANQTTVWDFHNINAGNSPELREAWATMAYADPNEVVNTVDLIQWYEFNLSIPPLASYTTNRKYCQVPADLAGVQQNVYLGLTTAHAHERLTRFSVFKHHLDGTEELVYETYDWAEPGNAFFFDRVQNPPLPIQGGNTWGAKSGYLTVAPGEMMSFECEFQNNLNQWVSFGDTTNDEMCNVFGFYFPSVGGMWNCFF